MIGVTGTDGKTTTTNQSPILLAAGLHTGMISTVNAVIGNGAGYWISVTTPEAPDVQHYLAQMVAASLTHVVLETTSHGLAQERVTACEFDIGVVTNITHERRAWYEGTGRLRQLFESGACPKARNASPDQFRRPVIRLSRPVDHRQEGELRIADRRTGALRSKLHQESNLMLLPRIFAQI
jgi:hypothetical protein